MYQKSERVLTLEKQLGKLQLESGNEYGILHKNSEKRKMKIAEVFLDSIKHKLNLDYSVNSGYSGFNIWNEKFQARFEVKLDEIHNYAKLTSTYHLEISQSAWFNSFSSFRPEQNDSKEVGKYFFMKDYLTIVEEATMSDVSNQLKDLFLEVKNECKRLESMYGSDISNLQKMIKDETDKLVDSLVEKVSEVRSIKEGVTSWNYNYGFKIVKRSPKKLIVLKFNKNFELPTHSAYEETMKKEDLKYYIESPDYSITL